MLGYDVDRAYSDYISNRTYKLTCPNSHPNPISGDAWLKSKSIRLSGSRPLSDGKGWEFQIRNSVSLEKQADLWLLCTRHTGG